MKSCILSHLGREPLLVLASRDVSVTSPLLLATSRNMNVIATAEESTRRWEGGGSCS